MREDANRNVFFYLQKEEEKEVEKHLAEVCRQLMVNLQDGNCTLTGLNHNGKIQFDGVEINGKGEAPTPLLEKSHLSG